MLALGENTVLFSYMYNIQYICRVFAYLFDWLMIKAAGLGSAL